MAITRTRRALVAVATALLLGSASAIGMALPAAAVSTTIYVATTGSDSSGDGSSAYPFATIQKAVNVAASGDTVSVAAGTFVGAQVSGKTLTITGVNAGTPGTQWADSATKTVITSLLRLYTPSTVSGLSFESAVEGDQSLALNAGAEGALVQDNVFRGSSQALALAALTGSATTTITANAFFGAGTSGQPNSVLIWQSSGILIDYNEFTGNGYSDSVSVNLIGGGITDIVVDHNVASNYANFVVANGNEDVGGVGIDGLRVSANRVLNMIYTAVYIGDNSDHIQIADNLILGGGSTAISFTWWSSDGAATSPVNGATGPHLAVNGNFLVGNVGGINVREGAINHNLDATHNVFVGNTSYAVKNASTFTVDASNSNWSNAAGPSVGGPNGTAGTGTITVLPLSTMPSPITPPTDDEDATTNPIEDADASTTGLTTTLDLGEDYANQWVALYGYSSPTFFGWFLADGSGVLTLTWPASTPSGVHSLAVYDASGTLIGWVNPIQIVGAALATGGTESVPIVWISGSLFVVGIALLALRRRKVGAASAD